MLPEQLDAMEYSNATSSRQHSRVDVSTTRSNEVAWLHPQHAVPRAVARKMAASSFLDEYEFSAPRIEEPLEDFRLTRPGESVRLNSRGEPFFVNLNARHSLELLGALLIAGGT
eukprot:CAMPEP_0178444734 /NCGR_PEP_ID=MMETSP0689_2-20121128/39713_1 /TAXON_ID=160604 /ORGANISM="Amphidinium massartii, Strain CS-259" /LENGTH=113 /DNA_ID=CAMNT_0020069081 /DNA_START=1 /DNA_END=338 /DNA_ORIENTATION=+